MDQSLSQSRAPHEPDSGLLSFLGPVVQPGLAWMLYDMPSNVGRGDKRDEQSCPRVVFEAFIPPDKTYRSPFPVDRELLREVVYNTPGACFRFVLDGDDTAEPSAGGDANTTRAPAAQAAEDAGALPFPPGKYRIHSTLAVPKRSADHEREATAA